MTESGTGIESINLTSLVLWILRDAHAAPMRPKKDFLPASSAAFCSAVNGPVDFPGVFTPTAVRKFNAPLRRMQFVPITIPIRPTRPSETAPRIRPNELLSADAAAAAAPAAVAFSEGVGVPERLILFEDDEKTPMVGVSVKDPDDVIIISIDDVGVIVLPGKADIDLVIDTDNVTD